MAKQRKQPEFIHCKVTLTTHPKAPWRVSYPVEIDGATRRKRRMFSTEQKAIDFAAEHEKDVADHGVRFGSITVEARRAFDHYRDARADLLADGIEAPTFETLVMDAVANLRREHADRQTVKMTVAEAVAAFVAYKLPRVGTRHAKTLQGHLRRFAKSFGTDPMDKVTGSKIEAWILALPGLGPVSRNKFRKSTKALFAFGCAKANGWCDHNPLKDIEPEKVKTTEPKAYRPEDAAKIMQAALVLNSPILPCLALGFFSGMRPSEAWSLDLGTINFDADGFRTPAFHQNGDPMKTGARIAPLTAACKAWLASQTRRSGFAWDRSNQDYYDEMAVILKAAKVKGIFDGARHSFISYRTAEIRDVARVADECGNSPNVIKRHYREIVTGEAATKYFAIRPEKPAENVTSIEDGRAIA
jgi:integrase